MKSNPDIREKLIVAAKESQRNYLNRKCTRRHRQLSEEHGPMEVNGSVVANKDDQNDILINNIYQCYYNDMHQSRNEPHQPIGPVALQHVRTQNHNDHGCNNEEAKQQLWNCGDSQSNFSSISSECPNYDFLDYPTTFYTQLRVLSNRNFKEAKPRMLSKLNWMQTVVLAVMAGAIWFNIPRTEEYLHDLQGWMFFSQTYWMLFALFGALNSCESYYRLLYI